MIRFEKVNKHYGPYHALVDITAEVAKGEVVVVCGPSGSGKSTLIRTVNRLEEIGSGSVYFEGRNVHAAMPGRELNRLRSRIGFVFQSFNLFPHLSALDNIVLSPWRVNGVGRAEARERAMALLERVGIAERAHAFPAQLSGGQQQRVAIARALAMSPKVLLFDEATSALDTRTEQEIQSALRALSAHRTTLTIAHRLSTVVDADEIIVLDQGRIAERGTHGELLAQSGLYAAMWAMQAEQSETV
jgi:polar amino acid transport system ATP-binding protein